MLVSSDSAIVLPPTRLIEFNPSTPSDPIPVSRIPIHRFLKTFAAEKNKTSIEGMQKLPKVPFFNLMQGILNKAASLFDEISLLCREVEDDSLPLSIFPEDLSFQ